MGLASLGLRERSPWEAPRKPEPASLGRTALLSPSIKAKGQAEESWGPALVTGFRGALAEACEEVESGG